MPAQSRLRGSIPRAFANHRSFKAYRYRREVLAIRARFPGLPASAERWLKEAALCALELDLAAEVQERATPRTAASLGRLRATLRQQLLDLEDKLALLAEPQRQPAPSVDREDLFK